VLFDVVLALLVDVESPETIVTFVVVVVLLVVTVVVW